MRLSTLLLALSTSRLQSRGQLASSLPYAPPAKIGHIECCFAFVFMCSLSLCREHTNNSVVSPKKHFRSSFQFSANVVCTCSTDHRFRSNQCNATNQQISLSLLSSKRVLDIGCRFLNSAPSECPRDSVRLSLPNNSAFSDENTEFGLLRCSYACE
jgi:hypothetical protein